MDKYILSTIAGVESLAKNEIKKQGGNILEVKDRMIEFSGEDDLMVRVNLWSRVGNKVFKVLAEGDNIDDFDKLYDLINSVNFKKYFVSNFPLSVKVKTINSELFSVPTIQKITTKSIIDNLTDKSGENIVFDPSLEKFEIMVLLINNKARILLNTSGESLHKRGYRTETGEAPIKENLAAALVLLSGWRFKETFYDLFCGSGTIAIEAAMLARNIAPGLNRDFSFNKLGIIDKNIFDLEVEKAKTKVYDGDYKIISSDMDIEVLEIAKNNAENAGVLENIDFRKAYFNDYLDENLKGTFVSNPPYGERLKVEDIELLYKDIYKLLTKNENLKGGIITSYFLEFNKIIQLKNYKRRKLYNGGEKTYFYRKIA